MDKEAGVEAVKGYAEDTEGEGGSGERERGLSVR